MNFKMKIRSENNIFIKRGTSKDDTYINIKKIADMSHLISYIRKVWNKSLFTIDNEPIMIYTWWKD